MQRLAFKGGFVFRYSGFGNSAAEYTVRHGVLFLMTWWRNFQFMFCASFILIESGMLCGIHWRDESDVDVVNKRICTKPFEWLELESDPEGAVYTCSASLVEQKLCRRVKRRGLSTMS